MLLYAYSQFSWFSWRSPFNIRNCCRPFTALLLTTTPLLQLFRKEAIYRRMQHYSRELERSQQAVEQLKVKTLSYQATLLAMETCWNQLLQQIHLVMEPNQQTSQEGGYELFTLINDSETDDPISETYSQALKDKQESTIHILQTVLSKSQSPSDIQTLQKLCQRLQSQILGIKGELALCRTQLAEKSAIAEKYLEQLAMAENRLERLKSETVQKMESKPKVKGEKDDEQTKAANGDHTHKTETNEPMLTNGLTQSLEQQDWKAVAEERSKAIERLERECKSLMGRLSTAQVELDTPSFERIKSLRLYKSMQLTIDQHKKSEESAKAEAASLQDYVLKLKDSQQESQATAQAEANTKANEWKTLLEKREQDLTRLRETRDALTSELHERKAKDAERLESLGQSKILANARGERIAMLVSENHRLKARLAAQEGEDSFFAFIMSNPQDESFVRAQEERIDILQRSKEALEATLKSISKSSPDAAAAAKSEADMRVKAAEMQQRLEKLEAVYGEAAISSGSADLKLLSDQLAKKEDELRSTRLELKASMEEPTALYTEIERLSALWESLDKQLKNKIFDLSVMEEKLGKSATEKAKADNKYFATMRELEAQKTVRSTQAREITKQAKFIERLAETEKSLTAQVHNLEKENLQLQKLISTRDLSISESRQQAERNQGLLELETQRASSLQAQVNEKISELAKQRNEFNILSEENAKLRIQANSQVAKIRAANATGHEAELITERDKLMTILKCSTCKIQLRNYVLVKCMHTFCKDCIDARLVTRQRKCPACNLAFANSDVQQIFFQ
ncbi:hypothetical protein CPB86DRAFT_697268 [Serendipita vermifera]|nr:hypothetical protein CPB86DRAFT_697268 [Serendipita vermifera]